MVSAETFVEIRRIFQTRAVQIVQPVFNVDARVTVYDIEQNADVEPVCFVDELFQLVWGTESATRREKRSDLVTKTSVQYVQQ